MASSVESRPKAVWTARTASSRSSARVTAETRISEVEIISMLMPASARAPKNFADTPGWLFMPAPTSAILPILSSRRRSAYSTVLDRLEHLHAAGAVGLREGEGDVRLCRLG